MSQLSGLNQTQQTPSNAQAADAQVAKNSTAKTQVSIANNLVGTFKLQGLPTPVTQQLTIAQANQLAQQPLIAVLQQQTALVFLQSQHTSSSLQLPPALMGLVQDWLKTDKNVTAKLPKELATLLSSKLGLSAQQLQTQIVSAALKQSLLQLSFFQGDPISELRLGVSTTQVAAEQLEQILQFMLPIPKGDDATLLIQQQNSGNQSSDEDTLRFRLQFNLDKLGKLDIEVELKEFELSTVCTCDSALLQQKVEKHWPLLESRLSSLGFDMSNQIKQKTRLDDKAPTPRPNSRINIKV